MELARKNIVLGVSGSIAAYKAPYLVRAFIAQGADVHVVMTPSSVNFVSPLVLANLSKHDVAVEMFQDSVQTGGSWHIHRARECDAMVVAPASAKTIAALAHGLSDTALGCVALALPTDTPLYIAPAMDTEMWEHPATQANLELLRSRGAVIIPPARGELASGLVGVGRLPEPEEIVRFILGSKSVSSSTSTNKQIDEDERSVEQRIRHFAEQSSRPLQQSIEADQFNAELMLQNLKNEKTTLSDLRDKTVVITAGPTRERIDDVRYISNYSSGKMGYALAAQARDAGARVVLISGPVSIPTPPGIEIVYVESAQQMFEAMQQYTDDFDVAILAAAVADFRPARTVDGKLKKSDLGEMHQLALQQNVDILASLGKVKKSQQILVGFALESENELQNGIEKLHRKNCDLIVVNSSHISHSAIGADENSISIVQRTADGEETSTWPSMSKHDCARVILQAVIQYQQHHL